MRWSSAISTRVSLEAAVRDLTVQVQKTIPAPDAGLLFASGSFASEYDRLLPLLAESLPIKNLIGCSGGGIIGGGWEIEDKPAIGLLVGQLPGAEVHLFHCKGEDLPDLDSPPERWYQLIGVDPQVQPSFILLVDAFSFPVTDFVQGLDFAYPQAVKVGGLASGGNRANALFLNQSLYREGAVGMALWGNCKIDAVVAQGCRPIGKIMQVSAGERNLILALDEQPPLLVLQELVEKLSAYDRELVQHSLFIGLVMDEFKANPTQGDFLIRNIIGVDPRSGAIAVGDRIRAGQRVQFHLRDGRASTDDIVFNLQNYPYADQAQGAVLFSCLGRGERLYGKPNHDSKVFEELVGVMPIGGFFCNGEIGPVGGNTFLHGYTSVFGIFRVVNNL
ncbi:MAG: FIST N-terminal domain-containing protein [Pseudanabaenaceae cyanobacterium]